MINLTHCELMNKTKQAYFDNLNRCLCIKLVNTK